MGSELPTRLSMEEFRPQFLSEIVGQREAIDRLRVLVEGVRNGRIVPPNLLMHGPSGIGKTTAARAFAREVLGEEFGNSFFHLRTSDDRGLGVVRDGIIPLSRTPPKRGAPFRIFFFDEADALAPEVQSALRSAVEEGQGTSLFLFACNDLQAISAPMRSRCTVLEFLPVPREEMRKLIERAVAARSLPIPLADFDRILDQSGGVPREAIKLLVEAIARASTGPPESPGPPSGTEGPPIA